MYLKCCTGWLASVFLKSSKCILDKLHVDGHELGNKRLHVVDGLVPLLEPVLVEGSNLAQFCLQFSITVLHKLLLQSNKDNLYTHKLEINTNL